MISVEFDREEKDGLQFSAVYVVGDRLVFDGNGKAFKLLQPGQTCDIHWRIVGPTGSSLVVTKKAGGPAKEIVNSTITADDDGRVADFTLFTV